MDKIRILIADNQVLVREGIKTLLAASGDFTIIGEVTDGAALLSGIGRLQPDVIIMDYQLPGFFSIDDVRRVYENFPGANILVVTTCQDKTHILKALEYGVNNYILKLCDQDEFEKAVYATARRERFFCGKVIDAILEKQFPRYEHCEPTDLSPREIEIVQLISKGMTNGTIAEKLFLSIHTVSTHRKNILKKLNLSNASELVMYAVKTGLVTA